MSQDTPPKPCRHDVKQDQDGLPLPLLCLGGAYIPLEQRSNGPIHREAVALSGVQEHHPWMIRRQGKKMICVDHNDAEILAMCSDDVRVEKREGRFSVTCGVPKQKHKSHPYLSVPLHFGLELVQSFPKSYLWLSQQSDKRKKNCLKMQGVDEVGQIPVYSVPNLHITQICDAEQDLPVEYKAYFLSKQELKKAWKSGRRYLTSASLAGRQQRRQQMFDTFHAKAAVIASRGEWITPPKSSHNSTMELNEDEDGLMEPAEVQEVAAELGMGGMPQFHDSPSEPSLIENAKSFVATFACGAIATLSPIIQGCSMACDSAIASIPLLDRLILGDTVPPRRAIMQEENMVKVLESAHLQNMKKLCTMENSTEENDAYKRLCKRFALSALWMGISIKLLMQQQILGSPGTAVLIASLPDDSVLSTSTKDVKKRHGSRKAQDPVVMDVLSSLIGSLQANEFVKTLTSDGDDPATGKTQSLQLEQILSLHNGLTIEYRKDKDTSTSASAGGIVFIGDITRPDGRVSHQENPFGMLQVSVGVHNGRHLIQHTSTQSISPNKR